MGATGSRDSLRVGASQLFQCSDQKRRHTAQKVHESLGDYANDTSGAFMRDFFQGVISRFADYRRGDTASRPQPFSSDPLEGEEVPCYPPFAKGLPVIAPERLLESQKKLVNDLKLALGLTKDEYQTLVLPILLKFAEYVHFLPASEAHHHRGAGGLFRHSLEVALYATRGSEAVVFDNITTPQQRKIAETRWRMAAFLGGLLHDAGKPITDMTVVDHDGRSEWDVFMDGTLYEWAVAHGITRYYLRWEKHRHGRHEQQATHALGRILSPEMLSYLRSGGKVIHQSLMDAVTGLSVSTPLSKLLIRSDTASVEKDLREQHVGHVDPHALGVAVDRFIVSAMRSLVSNGDWKANQLGSVIWAAEEGLFINWRVAAKHVTHRIKQDNIPGIPQDAESLAEVLLNSELAEGQKYARDDGTVAIMPYWHVEVEGLESAIGVSNVAFMGLKVVPEVLYANEEPPVPLDNVRIVTAEELEAREAKEEEDAERADEADAANAPSSSVTEEEGEAGSSDSADDTDSGQEEGEDNTGTSGESSAEDTDTDSASHEAASAPDKTDADAGGDSEGSGFALTNLLDDDDDDFMAPAAKKASASPAGSPLDDDFDGGRDLQRTRTQGAREDSETPPKKRAKKPATDKAPESVERASHTATSSESTPSATSSPPETDKHTDDKDAAAAPAAVEAGSGPDFVALIEEEMSPGGAPSTETASDTESAGEATKATGEVNAKAEADVDTEASDASDGAAARDDDEDAASEAESEPTSPVAARSEPEDGKAPAAHQPEEDQSPVEEAQAQTAQNTAEPAEDTRTDAHERAGAESGAAGAEAAQGADEPDGDPATANHPAEPSDDASENAATEPLSPDAKKGSGAGNKPTSDADSDDLGVVSGPPVSNAAARVDDAELTSTVSADDAKPPPAETERGEDAAVEADDFHVPAETHATQKDALSDDITPVAPAYEEASEPEGLSHAKGVAPSPAETQAPSDDDLRVTHTESDALTEEVASASLASPASEDADVVSAPPSVPEPTFRRAPASKKASATPRDADLPDKEGVSKERDVAIAPGRDLPKETTAPDSTLVGEDDHDDGDLKTVTPSPASMGGAGASDTEFAVPSIPTSRRMTGTPSDHLASDALDITSVDAPSSAAALEDDFDAPLTPRMRAGTRATEDHRADASSPASEGEAVPRKKSRHKKPRSRKAKAKRRPIHVHSHHEAPTPAYPNSSIAPKEREKTTVEQRERQLMPYRDKARDQAVRHMIDTWMAEIESGDALLGDILLLSESTPHLVLARAAKCLGMDECELLDRLHVVQAIDPKVLDPQPTVPLMRRLASRIYKRLQSMEEAREKEIEGVECDQEASGSADAESPGEAGPSVTPSIHNKPATNEVDFSTMSFFRTTQKSEAPVSLYQAPTLFQKEKGRSGSVKSTATTPAKESQADSETELRRTSGEGEPASTEMALDWWVDDKNMRPGRRAEVTLNAEDEAGDSELKTDDTPQRRETPAIGSEEEALRVLAAMIRRGKGRWIVGPITDEGDMLSISKRALEEIKKECPWLNHSKMLVASHAHRKGADGIVIKGRRLLTYKQTSEGE